MAIITCKECGGQMSDRATECPHCGCPIEICKGSDDNSEVNPEEHKPKKHGKYIIVSVVIAVLLLAGGAFFCIKNDVFASETLKITPEFTEAIQKYEQIDAFSEGMAAVKRDGKWGYINLKGEEVIPCQFSDAFPPGQFSEGLACVVDERESKDSVLINKRIGFINKKGEWVIEGDFYSEIPNLSQIWDEIDHTFPSFKDGKCAVWNMRATDFWDDNNQYSKIILVDKKGNTEEVADSIGSEMAEYRPFNYMTKIGRY